MAKNERQGSCQGTIAACGLRQLTAAIVICMSPATRLVAISKMGFFRQTLALKEAKLLCILGQFVACGKYARSALPRLWKGKVCSGWRDPSVSVFLRGRVGGQSGSEHPDSDFLLVLSAA